MYKDEKGGLEIYEDRLKSKTVKDGKEGGSGRKG